MKRRFARIATVLGSAASIVLAFTSCDPCSGVVDCVERPRLAVEGHLVDASGGGSVPGAQIAVVLAGDSTGAHDSVATTTDVRGFWQITVPAAASGTVTFDVVVSPPGYRTYRVRGLIQPASTIHGAAEDLGTWTEKPYYGVAVELVYRGNTTTKIANAPATFVRTEGPELSGPGWSGDTFQTVTDASGRITFIGTPSDSNADDDVIGDFFVTVDGATSRVPGVRLSPNYHFQSTIVQQYAAGPNLLYRIDLYNRSTGLPAPGIRVDFMRTGGIVTTPALLSGVTDVTGAFMLALFPQDTGSVVGDLTIESPSPSAPDTIKDLTFPTFDSDTARLFGAFGVGVQPPSVGVVRPSGLPITFTTLVPARRP